MTDQDKAMYLSMRGQSDIVKEETKQVPLNFFNNGIDLEQCKRLSVKAFMKPVEVNQLEEPVKEPLPEEPSEAIALVEKKRNIKKWVMKKPWKANWTLPEVETLIQMREKDIPFYTIGVHLRRSKESVSSKFYDIAR